MPKLVDGKKPKALLDMTPFELLCYWITTREMIRLKKEAGEPKPWTYDPILRKYRFCNVRRMDDKVSQWLWVNWYLPHLGHPNMLVASALARQFNRPEALDKIAKYVFYTAEPFQSELVKLTLRHMKSRGEKIFGGAYMIRGVEGIDKTEMVVSKVCQPLCDNKCKLDTTSMQRSVEILLPYWGLSSFLAGQIVADMRWAVEGAWEDRHSWAPIGPGSRRGMNRLLGRPIEAPMKQEEFTRHLQKLTEKLHKALPSSIMNRLEAMDIQNTLCESDKYARALGGEGTPKQLYPGG